jgi:hypothetical protein
MNVGNELAGHRKRALQVIYVSASRAETRFATKSNVFKFTTIRTGIESTTIRWITAVNHLGDVFKFSLARMKFVKNMLIIIDKNVL